MVVKFIQIIYVWDEVLEIRASNSVFLFLLGEGNVEKKKSCLFIYQVRERLILYGCVKYRRTKEEYTCRGKRVSGKGVAENYSCLFQDKRNQSRAFFLTSAKRWCIFRIRVLNKCCEGRMYVWMKWKWKIACGCILFAYLKLSQSCSSLCMEITKWRCYACMVTLRVKTNCVNRKMFLKSGWDFLALVYTTTQNKISSSISKRVGK